MAARFLPMIAVLSLVLPNAGLEAGPESAIALERTSNAGSPFRVGDRLQLDVQGTGNSDAPAITVLQTANWPWVLICYDKERKPYEEWINFALVRSVRRVAAK